MNGRKIIANTNDLLALLTLIVIIPGLWIVQGLGIITIPGEIIGATIAAWTLVLQYYFRRAPQNSTPTPPEPPVPPTPPGG